MGSFRLHRCSSGLLSPALSSPPSSLAALSLFLRHLCFLLWVLWQCRRAENSLQLLVRRRALQSRSLQDKDPLGRLDQETGGLGAD